MMAARTGAPVHPAGPDERARFAVGDAGVVFAGDFADADWTAMMRALPYPSDHRPALVSVDLRRQSIVVVAPHTGITETRLSLAGELDLATAPLLAWTLGVTLDRRPARVVLDLRRLRLIDVRCAGAIAGAAARIAEWNGTLVARRPQPAVVRVFQLCGLSDLLHPRARASHPSKETDA